MASLKSPAILFFAALLMPAMAAAQTFNSSAGAIGVRNRRQGLVHPWSLAFLPDGRMLVTERPGRLRIVAHDGNCRAPLAGVPAVTAAARPACSTSRSTAHFAQNGTIYFCYAERRRAAATHRGGARQARRRRGAELDDVTSSSASRPGVARRPLSAAASRRRATATCSSRSAITSPPRKTRRRSTTTSARSCASRPTAACRRTIRSSTEPARCRRSGPTATATPQGARASIPPTASCGSRSTARWAATRSTSSRRARITAGRWSATASTTTARRSATGKTPSAGMEQPLWHWTPSIAPSGMAFYTGDLFPGWKGSLFNGALKFQLLSRLELEGRQGGEGRAPAARPARAHPRRARRARTARSICSPTTTPAASCA